MPTACLVCNHRGVLQIQQALASGQPLAAVAKTFGLSRSTLRRHVQAQHGGPDSPFPVSTQLAENRLVESAGPREQPAVSESAVARAATNLALLRASHASTQVQLTQATDQARQAGREVLRCLAMCDERGDERATAAQLDATTRVAQLTTRLEDLTAAIPLAEQLLASARAARQAREQAHWRAVAALPELDRPEVYVAHLLSGAILHWMWEDKERQPRGQARADIASDLKTRFSFTDEDDEA